MTEQNSKEFAEQEFDRFIELNDIDFDMSDLSDDEKSGMVKDKRVLVRAIVNGRLTVDEDGVPELTTLCGNTLKFEDPNVSHYAAMDKRKAEIGKTTIFLSAWTKKGSVVSKLSRRDFRVCTALMNTFLA